MPIASEKHPLRPTLEHLTPASVGGKGGENLRAAHRVCNQARGVLSEGEFRRMVGLALAEFRRTEILDSRAFAIAMRFAGKA
jgi:5-methylcytosine-specific restriction endonuclease McrA